MYEPKSYLSKFKLNYEEYEATLSTRPGSTVRSSISSRFYGRSIPKHLSRKVLAVRSNND